MHVLLVWEIDAEATIIGILPDPAELVGLRMSVPRPCYEVSVPSPSEQALLNHASSAECGTCFINQGSKPEPLLLRAEANGGSVHCIMSRRL